MYLAGFSIHGIVKPPQSILERFYQPKTKQEFVPISSYSPFPAPDPDPIPLAVLLPDLRQRLIFLSLQICQFWTFPIRGVLQYIALCTWLLSHSIMFSGFICVVACISTLCPFIAKSYPIVWTDHVLCSCLSVDGHWHRFLFLAVMNNSVMNMVACFCGDIGVPSLTYYTRSGTAGSYIRSMVRCWGTVRAFPEAPALLAALRFHQCMRVPGSAHPQQPQSLSLCVLTSMPVGVRWCLGVAWFPFPWRLMTASVLTGTRPLRVSSWEQRRFTSCVRLAQWGNSYPVEWRVLDLLWMHSTYETPGLRRPLSTLGLCFHSTDVSGSFLLLFMVFGSYHKRLCLTWDCKDWHSYFFLRVLEFYLLHLGLWSLSSLCFSLVSLF